MRSVPEFLSMLRGLITAHMATQTGSPFESVTDNPAKPLQVTTRDPSSGVIQVFEVTVTQVAQEDPAQPSAKAGGDTESSREGATTDASPSSSAAKVGCCGGSPCSTDKAADNAAQ